MSNRDNLQKCHVWHVGRGASKKQNNGLGCSCPVNLLYLDHYTHSVLDGRTINYSVEHYKKSHRDILEKEPHSYRHKLAFGAAFGLLPEIECANRHKELREQGKASCCKWKK